jgi:hypothetical protein
MPRTARDDGVSNAHPLRVKRTATVRRTVVRNVIFDMHAAQ